MWKKISNLKENPFPYKDTCSTREREWELGILFELFIKLMSIMVLIKLIITKLGWNSMFNDKRGGPLGLAKCRIWEKKIG